MPAPARPKIYHITHWRNLASILEDGELLSDATMIERGGPAMVIGMSGIKQRRLSLPVPCHRGSFVGEYVPFYFCPRSVMLYLIYQANHAELTYREGQEPIVHLEANLRDVVGWADQAERRWAFSLSNAGARYAEFRCNMDNLDEVNWDAVVTNRWSAPEVKEGKQAEFLAKDAFPWELVSRIGVRSVGTKAQVDAVLADAGHKPQVLVRPDWYY